MLPIFAEIRHLLVIHLWLQRYSAPGTVVHLCSTLTIAGFVQNISGDFSRNFCCVFSTTFLVRHVEVLVFGSILLRLLLLYKPLGHFSSNVPTKYQMWPKFFTDYLSFTEIIKKFVTTNCISTIFQYLGTIPGLNRPGKCDLNSRSFHDLYKTLNWPISARSSINTRRTTQMTNNTNILDSQISPTLPTFQQSVEISIV